MVTLLIVLYHENRLNMIINVNPINTAPDPSSDRKISVLLYYRGCERHIVISSRGRPMHIIVCLMICDMEIVKLEITSRRLPVQVHCPATAAVLQRTSDGWCWCWCWCWCGRVISANVNTVPQFLLLLATPGPAQPTLPHLQPRRGTGGTPSRGARVSKCKHRCRQELGWFASCFLAAVFTVGQCQFSIVS